MWNAYKKAESSFWTAEDLDFEMDLQLCKTWLAHEKRCLINAVVAPLVTTIPAVVELVRVLAVEVQSAEARAFYGYQLAK